MEEDRIQPHQYSRPNVHVEVDGAHGLECPLCGIKFNRRSNCTEHQKMHNLQWNYNYPCKECDRSFGRRSDLKRHMSTVNRTIGDD
ncbi:Zinc finger, C2H2-like [Penicillium camemberti]|uniref:Zinc finger, C2H2-like n=1 Tax=Penicillium camemberti (strain FM 013) TaxID=1429867 RepID=A0A0G4PW14_PENC3|nr:Zinc finger, C2H2-like [Penicillium camemberti]